MHVSILRAKPPLHLSADNLLLSLFSLALCGLLCDEDAHLEAKEGHGLAYVSTTRVEVAQLSHAVAERIDAGQAVDVSELEWLSLVQECVEEILLTEHTQSLVWEPHRIELIAQSLDKVAVELVQAAFKVTAELFLAPLFLARSYSLLCVTQNSYMLLALFTEIQIIQAVFMLSSAVHPSFCLVPSMS